MSAIDAAIPHWHNALASPYGWGVVVTSPTRAKNQLYAARKQLVALGLTVLDEWTVRTSPENPACELYLLPKDPAAHRRSVERAAFEASVARPEDPA